MTTTMTVDAARVELMLSELRLPSMKAIWPRLAAQSDKEGWPAAKFLAALAEHEVADRGRRRFERHLAEARLPAGKTLAAFDFEATPMLSKAQIMAQVARRELALESTIAKLDTYDLLILDDIAYVSKDHAETSVLFELIAARYERRSMLITANQPFGEWGKIFPDQAMTLAAIDRLVHHATILEMNVDSYRRKAALDRKRGPGRPPAHTTQKELQKLAD